MQEEHSAQVWRCICLHNLVSRLSNRVSVNQDPTRFASGYEQSMPL
jgi:hypothetical protein